MKKLHKLEVLVFFDNFGFKFKQNLKKNQLSLLKPT